ncbi:diacylglycerol kinase family lipid kinase [bacterium]|nr:diacylglycerol kinase family lipid kinase [bacterium]
MKIGFVVNPKAGVTKSAYQEIQEFSKKLIREKHQIDIKVTQGRGDATMIAREWANQKFDLVASVGGDGTANETAQGLIDSDTAFTIIPYGSGNGLARGLSIPLNRELAVHAMGAFTTKLIDVGEVIDRDQQRLFFGFSGTGYDAFIGKLFNERHGRRGLMRYVYLSLTAYNKFKPVSMTLKLNDQEIACEPFVLAIANTNEYGNGAIIAPRAIPDDGYFEVCLLQEMTFLKGVLHGWRLFNGSIAELPGALMLRAQELEIIPSEKIYYHLDGEAQETSGPLKFRILPKRIRVMVPA